MDSERYKKEVDKIVAKIIELEEEEERSGQNYSINEGEIASLGLSLAQMIANHKAEKPDNKPSIFSLSDLAKKVLYGSFTPGIHDTELIKRCENVDRLIKGA